MRYRLRVWREVVRGPSRWVIVASGLVGGYETWVAPRLGWPKVSELWSESGWSWQTWALIIVAFALALVLEGAFRRIRQLEALPGAERGPLVPAPALFIACDNASVAREEKDLLIIPRYVMTVTGPMRLEAMRLEIAGEYLPATAFMPYDMTPGIGHWDNVEFILPQRIGVGDYQASLEGLADGKWSGSQKRFLVRVPRLEDADVADPLRRVI